MPPFSDPHSSFPHHSTWSRPTAATTFFSIPELVLHLGYFLTTQDIALFRATNKTHYRAFHTLFWRTINLLDDGNSVDQPDSKTIRLLDSRPATRAFALNQKYIQSLSCRSSFIVHHYYGLCVLLDVAEYLKPGVPLMDVSSKEVLQDLTTTVQNLMATTTLHNGTVSKRPSWLIPNSISMPFECTSTVPAIYTANAGLLFPPMTNLTRLECAIKMRCISEGWSLPSRYPYSKLMTTIILCWVLYFNKGLTHVKLDGIDLTAYKPVRILAQTLSGLVHLRSLELSTDMTAQDQTKDLVGEFLLFHCSHTLEVFHLKAEVGFSSRTVPVVVTPWYDHTLTEEYFQKCAPLDWMSSSFSAAVAEAGGVEIPRMPMPLLRSLRMPDKPEIGYTDELCPILENCPALESLVLPTVGQRPLSLNRMLSIIKDQPLRLKRITVDYPRKYDEFHEAPGSVIDILDQHTLESLNISFFKEGPYTCLTSKLFRHSETLRDLTFDAVESLYSTTILDLLCNCRVLEKLVVRGGGNSDDSNNKNNLDDIRYLQDISLAVTHAVAKPWVCLRLSHLEIPVMLDWFAYTNLLGRGGTSGWFHDWRHTQGDSNWEALRKFYQQIGALHHLQVLDLKACLVYPGSVPSGATWSDISFPGMLLMPFTPKPSSSSSSLPARNKNIIPGFLDLLSGLTKLRELRGSVRVDLPVMMSAMRLDSYRWMARHWPMLKVAEFLLPGYQSALVYTLPPHITWLFTERPSLKLAADKKPDKPVSK
ncbi:hypothetical protein BG015_007657 [Linnemannia schmuckeri]|uniref:Uncharacterized protein n=1 Tax=Linnemannia schmuckeri TaxID=64567 RepID=A0A9P5VB97_9FUNG|nr:hypothetical protein BG015_007657 [Linnemannia schmuckeri]